MFELVENSIQPVNIKVIGVGGGGCNSILHMQNSQVEGVEFLFADTDSSTLEDVPDVSAIRLGTSICQGRGAGYNTEIGRQAALENREDIIGKLEGADMVFIIAGMGGGTGTGSTPIIGELARELGILTIAIVTKPFPFEGDNRLKIAETGLVELNSHVDSLFAIPNERLLSKTHNNSTLQSAFATANIAQQNALQGITDLIIKPGMINVDFADVKTVMSEMGTTMFGKASASGINRAADAANAAVNSPFFDNFNLHKARGVLVSITAGVDLNLGEFSEVGSIIEGFASDYAVIVVGTIIDSEMTDELSVTIIAAGLDGKDNLQQAHKEDNQPPQEIPEYLDIPAFLRRGAASTEVKKGVQPIIMDEVHSCKLIAHSDVPDEELAELINHLSNVYRSVGGDELIVSSVNDLPPNAQDNHENQSLRKAGSSR